jgi:ribonucleotide reductase alpha subunit
VGTNFSQIRGGGEKLSGGGTPSGLMSFLKIGDRAAGAIKAAEPPDGRPKWFAWTWITLRSWSSSTGK